MRILITSVFAAMVTTVSVGAAANPTPKPDHYARACQKIREHLAKEIGFEPQMRLRVGFNSDSKDNPITGLGTFDVNVRQSDVEYLSDAAHGFPDSPVREDRIEGLKRFRTRLPLAYIDGETRRVHRFHVASDGTVTEIKIDRSAADFARTGSAIHDSAVVAGSANVAFGVPLLLAGPPAIAAFYTVVGVAGGAYIASAIAHDVLAGRARKTALQQAVADERASGATPSPFSIHARFKEILKNSHPGIEPYNFLEMVTKLRNDRL